MAHIVLRGVNFRRQEKVMPFIIGELLLYHPHNYSVAFDRLERSISPRDVKRAIDYIHAHFVVYWQRWRHLPWARASFWRRTAR
jgi:hypothetical protein